MRVCHHRWKWSGRKWNMKLGLMLADAASCVSSPLKLLPLPETHQNGGRTRPSFRKWRHIQHLMQQHLVFFLFFLRFFSSQRHHSSRIIRAQEPPSKPRQNKRRREFLQLNTSSLAPLDAFEVVLIIKQTAGKSTVDFINVDLWSPTLASDLKGIIRYFGKYACLISAVELDERRSTPPECRLGSTAGRLSAREQGKEAEERQTGQFFSLQNQFSFILFKE